MTTESIKDLCRYITSPRENVTTLHLQIPRGSPAYVAAPSETAIVLQKEWPKAHLTLAASESTLERMKIASSEIESRLCTYTKLDELLDTDNRLFCFVEIDETWSIDFLLCMLHLGHKAYQLSNKPLNDTRAKLGVLHIITFSHGPFPLRLRNLWINKERFRQWCQFDSNTITFEWPRHGTICDEPPANLSNASGGTIQFTNCTVWDSVKTSLFYMFERVEFCPKFIMTVFDNSIQDDDLIAWIYRIFPTERKHLMHATSQQELSHDLQVLNMAAMADTGTEHVYVCIVRIDSCSIPSVSLEGWDVIVFMGRPGKGYYFDENMRKFLRCDQIELSMAETLDQCSWARLADSALLIEAPKIPIQRTGRVSYDTRGVTSPQDLLNAVSSLSARYEVDVYHVAETLYPLPTMRACLRHLEMMGMIRDDGGRIVSPDTSHPTEMGLILRSIHYDHQVAHICSRASGNAQVDGAMSLLAAIKLATKGEFLFGPDSFGPEVDISDLIDVVQDSAFIRLADCSFTWLAISLWLHGTIHNLEGINWLIRKEGQPTCIIPLQTPHPDGSIRFIQANVIPMFDHVQEHLKTVRACVLKVTKILPLDAFGINFPLLDDSMVNQIYFRMLDTFCPHLVIARRNGTAVDFTFVDGNQQVKPKYALLETIARRALSKEQKEFEGSAVGVSIGLPECCQGECLLTSWEWIPWPVYTLWARDRPNFIQELLHM